MSDQSDQSLLRAWVSGDVRSFDALYRAYARRVHATAWRLTGSWEDAEDTLQEVFLRLARHAPRIRNGSAVSSWIFRTTVNCAQDRLRRRRATIRLDDGGAVADRVVAVVSLRRDAERREAAEREDMIGRIEAEVPGLPERQAAVFVLRVYQRLSHAEIAEALKCGEATVRSHYSLACRFLREKVAQREAGEARAEARRTAPERGGT